MASINLFASLKDLSRNGATGEKFGIRVDAGDLILNLDEERITADATQALVAQFKANLSTGRGLDGAPLRGLRSSTMRARHEEAKLGSRGGEADRRYKDTSFRSIVKRNYTKDYSSRLGSFTPSEGGPRGLVSGLLIESITARPVGSGRGWIVYVASRRGKPRTGESVSALQSVLGLRPGQRVPLTLNQPIVAEAMKTIASESLFTNAAKAFRSTARIARMLTSVASRINALGGED